MAIHSALQGGGARRECGNASLERSAARPRMHFIAFIRRFEHCHGQENPAAPNASRTHLLGLRPLLPRRVAQLRKRFVAHAASHRIARRRLARIRRLGFRYIRRRRVSKHERSALSSLHANTSRALWRSLFVSSRLHPARFLAAAAQPASISGSTIARLSSGRKSLIHTSRQRPPESATICIEAAC